MLQNVQGADRTEFSALLITEEAIMLLTIELREPVTEFAENVIRTLSWHGDTFTAIAVTLVIFVMRAEQ
jgi:hypothetical protein